MTRPEDDPYASPELEPGWVIQRDTAWRPPDDRRPPASRVARKVEGTHLEELPSRQRARLDWTHIDAVREHLKGESE